MTIAQGSTAGSMRSVPERLTQRRGCPVCGETRADVLHTQQLVLPVDFGLPEAFDVVACTSCGMAYSDTIGDAERLTAHYRAESYSMRNWEDHKRDVRTGVSVLGPPLDVARLRVVVEQLSELLPTRNLRVLDVGCASGTLLALLGEAGFTDVQGIDPSASAVESAHRLGQRARVGDLDAALPPELGTFDVVILSHVLEHLGRPREALNNLRRALRGDALVYAEVPDAARYAEFLVEPFVDFNHEHVNHFSMFHLNELFRATGFAVTTAGRKLITVVNWPYPVIYGIWRMLETSRDDSMPAVSDGGRLRKSLVPYISGSRDLLAKYSDEIRTKLSGRHRVAVRCLGYRAWTLLANTILRDIDIVAYIDNDPLKQTLTVEGIRVCGPEAPLAAGVPIVVLAYHVETVVVDEYAASDPKREVITVGRSRPISRESEADSENTAAAVDHDVLTGHIR